MPPQDSGATELLRRASDGLTPDVERLVGGGVARGRSRQVRARIGSTLLSLASIGAFALVARQLGGAGGAADAGIATGGASSARETPSPDADVIVVDEGRDVPTPGVWRIPAEDIPAAVGSLALESDVTDVLRDAPYDVRDAPDEKVAHFPVRGMLTTLEADRSDPPRDARGGIVIRSGRPRTLFGVTSRTVTVWRAGWSITVTSYNAAEHRDSPIVSPSPALSLQQLATVASSDLWFE